MTREEIESEIASLSAQIEVLQLHKRRLRAMLDGPRVEAVTHYWRNGREGTDAYDSVADALGVLSEGEGCAPIGVSVGGYMLTADEAAEHGGDHFEYSLWTRRESMGRKP